MAKKAKQSPLIPVKVQHLLASRGFQLPFHPDPIVMLKHAWDECIRYREEAYAKCKGLNPENADDKAKIDVWEDEATERDDFSIAVEQAMYKRMPTTWDGLNVLAWMTRHEVRYSGTVDPDLAITLAKAVAAFSDKYDPAQAMKKAA
jgi:hypothetical protein